MEQFDLQRIVEPLLSWYDVHARILPWREAPTAYRVWVSEIMLQQTRVEAVKPYYERFMKALPDVKALAEAEEETLLKLWEGLGYYNRVRNLNKAAIQIMEKYQGVIPNTYEELCALPGIGSYTAGAVASIAYQRSVPAVDGNVLRVISRIRLDERDILQASVKRSVEQDLSKIMPQDRPGDFNQALMELGATVCIPNGEPKCNICPWNSLCLAKENGCISEYPKREEKKKRTIEKKTVLILKEGERIAIQKRPSKGLLAGLYQFPMLEGHLKEGEVIANLKEKGMMAVRIEKLPPASHIFSHKEWHMIGYAIRVDELEKYSEEENMLFVHPEKIQQEYPVPSALSAYAACI